MVLACRLTDSPLDSLRCSLTCWRAGHRQLEHNQRGSWNSPVTTVYFQSNGNSGMPTRDLCLRALCGQSSVPVLLAMAWLAGTDCSPMDQAQNHGTTDPQTHRDAHGHFFPGVASTNTKEQALCNTQHASDTQTNQQLTTHLLSCPASSRVACLEIDDHGQRTAPDARRPTPDARPRHLRSAHSVPSGHALVRQDSMLRHLPWSMRPIALCRPSGPRARTKDGQASPDRMSPTCPGRTRH